MGKAPKNPPPAPTPAPVAESVTDQVADDVIKGNRERKMGRRESFLTRGQRYKSTEDRRKSLLGRSTNKLG